MTKISHAQGQFPCPRLGPAWKRSRRARLCSALGMMGAWLAPPGRPAPCGLYSHMPGSSPPPKLQGRFIPTRPSKSPPKPSKAPLLAYWTARPGLPGCPKPRAKRDLNCRRDKSRKAAHPAPRGQASGPRKAPGPCFPCRAAPSPSGPRPFFHPQSTQKSHSRLRPKISPFHKPSTNSFSHTPRSLGPLFGRNVNPLRGKANFYS